MDKITGDLTTSEVAKILDVTRNRVVAMIREKRRAKRLPARNVAAPGKPAIFLVSLRDLEEFMKVERKVGRPKVVSSGQ